jgi:hypothetical protein
VTALALNQFRKVMILRDPLYEQKSVLLSLAPLGSSSPVHGKVAWRLAFWIPLPPGHKKRTKDEARKSAVPDASPAELQAIRDGVLQEIHMEVDLPADTPEHFRDRLFMQAWENLALHRAGIPMAIIKARDPACHDRPILVSGEMAAREFDRRSLSVGA